MGHRVRNIPYNIPVNQEIVRAAFEILHKYGISQNEMARRMGVTSSTLSFMMTGQADFSVIMMQRLCNAFHLRAVVRFDPEVDDPSAAKRTNFLIRSVGGNDTPIAIDRARAAWHQAINEGKFPEYGAVNAARRAVEGFSDAAREAVERDLQELIAIELAAEQELLAAERPSDAASDDTPSLSEPSTKDSR